MHDAHMLIFGQLLGPDLMWHVLLAGGPEGHPQQSVKGVGQRLGLN